MRYFIKTFGCQANTADSEKIIAFYQLQGWEAAKNINEADLVVINTCSVRQSAEHRVYGLINNLKKFKIENSKLKIIVTGCMLRYPKKWLRDKMPAVNEFKKITEFKIHNSELITHNSSSHALVSIMEGCNNFCSYCVVPYSRGREKSRPFDEIVCEVEKLAEHGCREIMLLGQNVNSYQPSFAQLLIALDKINGLEKIKFMTSNPWDFTDDMVRALKLPKVDKYLHLPVQSGDNKILKRMNRHYTAQNYLNLVEKIRKAAPEITIGTDIIVGFPGETEEQFQNTVNLCQKVGFCLAYISKYSPRPGTVAYKLKDDIPQQEKKRRWRILEELINGHKQKTR